MPPACLETEFAWLTARLAAEGFELADMTALAPDALGNVSEMTELLKELG